MKELLIKASRAGAKQFLMWWDNGGLVCGV